MKHSSKMQFFLILAMIASLIPESILASEQSQCPFTRKECCMLSVWVLATATVQTVNEAQNYLKPKAEPQAPSIKKMQ